MIKPFVVALLGPKNLGRLEYYFKPGLKAGWGVLNGQTFRRQIYSKIIDRIEFKAIVETGTYLGTTTEFFAQSGLPVYSVEIDPRAHGYASQRFHSRQDKIHLFQGNSPEFLKRLAKDKNFPRSRVFFYLDAHVQDSSAYHQAPLVDELEIIFTNWSEAVVLVDDFQVPGMDYLFDDWGPGKNLNLDCLKPLDSLKLTAFFPTIDAKTETGVKRGWVLLCKELQVVKILSQITDIKPQGIQ